VLKKALCFAVLFCLSGAAHAAFTIEPALISIKANMKETMAWVELVHTGGGPMAVQMTVYERLLDLDGNNRTDSLVRSGDFAVYPSEVILYQGERVKVQVTYKGNRKVTADRAYFLFSKEVPLKIDEEGPGVKVSVNALMNYYTILAVETGKPGSLTFVSSKAIGDGNIEVIVENKSSGRVVMENAVIIAGGKQIRDFTGKKNSIMPGQRRRFTFKHPKPLSAREFSVGPSQQKR